MKNLRLDNISNKYDLSNNEFESATYYKDRVHVNTVCGKSIVYKYPEFIMEEIIKMSPITVSRSVDLLDFVHKNLK